MAYKPLYSNTQVEVPAFLNEMVQMDPLGAYTKYQQSSLNDIKTAGARRQEDAARALSSLDMELQDDVRDKEIQKILAQSGDLKGLNDYRESKAREQANSYLAKGREVAMLDSLRNQPQELVSQFLSANQDVIPKDYQNLTENRDSKFTKMGNEIIETNTGGMVKHRGTVSGATGTGGSGTSKPIKYIRPKVVEMGTSEDGTPLTQTIYEAALAKNPEEQARLEAEGFNDASLFGTKDMYGRTIVTTPFATNEASTRQIPYDQMSPEEQAQFVKDFQKTGKGFLEFEKLIAEQRGMK